MTLTRVGRCPSDTTGSNASCGGAENFFKKKEPTLSGRLCAAGSHPTSCFSISVIRFLIFSRVKVMKSWIMDLFPIEKTSLSR